MSLCARSSVDRVLASEAKGRRFDSCWARQIQSLLSYAAGSLTCCLATTFNLLYGAELLRVRHCHGAPWFLSICALFAILKPECVNVDKIDVILILS